MRTYCSDEKKDVCFSMDCGFDFKGCAQCDAKRGRAAVGTEAESKESFGSSESGRENSIGSLSEVEL